MVKDDGLTARQRYDLRWPRITIRVADDTYRLLKTMADSRNQPLGQFCANIIFTQNCKNCKSVFRRRQPTMIVEELQRSLKAAGKKKLELLDQYAESLKTYEEKNKILADSLEDWQIYSGTLHDEIEILKADLELSKQTAKTLHRERTNEFKNLESKLDECENDSLARIQSLEDVIQGHKDSKAALQRESVELKGTIYILEEEVAELQGCKKGKADLRQRNDALQRDVQKWEARWNTVTEDVSDKLQELADDVGISQSEVVKDMIAVGLRHTNDIYFEDLEAQ